MADKLLHDYKNSITELILKPSSGGVFEVMVNGSLVHSKKQTNAFPDEDAVVKEAGSALGA